jgi:hypothetical protein
MSLIDNRCCYFSSKFARGLQHQEKGNGKKRRKQTKKENGGINKTLKFKPKG